MFRWSWNKIRWVWKVVWTIWSVVLTGTLLVALVAAAYFEFAARKAVDPDQITLMPAPTLIAEGVVDPFAELAVPAETPRLGVFFATDREPAEKNDPSRFFRNQRSSAVHLGVGFVEFGDGITTWDEIKAITNSSDRERDPRLKIGDIQRLGVVPDSTSIFDAAEDSTHDESAQRAGQDFVDAVSRKLADSADKDVIIYVHGYKVPFENPLLVATEFWHYLGYEGVMVAYSWPSTPNFLAYGSDLETTHYSARHLRKFIEFLAANTEAERIHILGYSAGTRLVMSTLDELALINSERAKSEISADYRLGQVILVCSDVDRGIFGHQLENGVWKIPDRLTIYVSESDNTLGMSEVLFQRQRIGRLIKEDSFSAPLTQLLRNQEHLDFIDVTNAENVSANNGHAYFHKSPWVSSDVLLTLRYALSPSARGLDRAGESPLWHFPNDYPSRLAQVEIPAARAPTLREEVDSATTEEED